MWLNWDHERTLVVLSHSRSSPASYLRNGSQRGSPPSGLVARSPGGVIDRSSGDWGRLEAEKGVLVASDGGSRRVPARFRRDDETFAGDGWNFKAAQGW